MVPGPGFKKPPGGRTGGYDGDPLTPDEYLRSIMPSPEEVERFAEEVPPGDLSRNKGWTYDEGLGWVLRDSVRSDGIDNSKTFYRYDEDGARRVVNFRDLPCRIHCYGDSMTHCDQVSDGETWAEYLAAHLQEPVRNFGIGGYGVYQAWRRMQTVEAATPASLVILNIWADDHFRSLDAWRSIRFGRRSPCGFPLPHLRVNLERGTCEERPNPIRSRRELPRLCDPGFVRETFADDPILRIVAARKGAFALAPPPGTPAGVDPVAVSFGFPTAPSDGGDAAESARRLHQDAALLSTRWILERAERFCGDTGKRLLVILSHGGKGIQDAILGKPRWDQSLLDWLKTRSFPAVDLRDAHAAEYRDTGMRCDVPAYVQRYMFGHYNPAGNFFTFQAIRRPVVDLLDPKPLPYR